MECKHKLWLAALAYASRRFPTVTLQFKQIQRVPHQRVARRVRLSTYIARAMPKRKDIVDSDEDEAIETPDDSEAEKPKKTKVFYRILDTTMFHSPPTTLYYQAKTVKKPNYGRDETDEEEERPIKKKKPSKSVST